MLVPRRSQNCQVSLRLWPILLLATLASGRPSSYYVDCGASSPGNGTVEGPWNSFDEPNEFVFAPGDTLALKSNVTCKGILSPKGSGTSSQPIRLTSYPIDSILGPPVIHADGANSSLLLTNQDHWRITKIAFTNPASNVARRQGITILANDGGVHYGITIEDNTIYDVAGQTNKTGELSSDFANSAGILLSAVNGSRYDGVAVRDNTIKDCGGGAMKIRPGQIDNQGSNIRVSYNKMDACGGDGIVVQYSDAPSLDHNVASNLGKGKYPWKGGNFAGIWVMASHNPVMRHNVVYGSIMSLHDSTAFDCDWGVTGTCIVEYNYSHDNAGGAFLDCDGCGVSGGARQIVRYNIFENDCRMISVSENSTLEFYNNAMYCADRDFELQLPQNATKMTNNIFVGRENATLPVASNIVWENNLFHGLMPPTEDGHLGDPLFASPRTRGSTLGAGFGYKLRAGSPAIGSGIAIKDNGGKDYFGRRLGGATKPNIGPYSGKGIN
ncbi:hypothetical protein BN1708_013148, partial [Verticillium longisporum]